MKPEEILKAAKEAGCVKVNSRPGMKAVWWSVSENDLERFAAIIEKRTIERGEAECKRIAAEPWWSEEGRGVANQCSAAIRKLGDE